MNTTPTVIFDLDGTLVDDEYATETALRAFHETYGSLLGLTIGDLSDRWKELHELYFGQFLNRALSMQEQRRRRVLHLFQSAGCPLDATEADSVFSVYRDAYVQSWRAFPDVVPTLNELEACRMSVLTNGEQRSQSQKLCATGLDRYFENLYSSDRLGVAKPSPEAFRKVCAEMGTTAEYCIYVGDNLETDARGSVAAGLIGVWLNRKRLTAAGSGYKGRVIETLTELIPLVKRSELEPAKDEKGRA